MGTGFAYDGFGNLTGKTVTQGSAPTLSVSFDPLTNRQNGQSYDANGNPAGGYLKYDVENRMIAGPSGYYAYDHAGKRVKKVGGAEEFYFYGIGGQKLATAVCTGPEDGTGCGPTLYNVYFGGKLVKSKGAVVATDRLGSVRGELDGGSMTYYPYGEERTSTADGREKFGTYMRDSVSQDYADQRYYEVGTGRFDTPDPYKASAGSSDPGSWNRYLYVGGDPINFADSTGMESEGASDGCSVNGLWSPTCDLPVTRYAPVSAFTKATNNLSAAAQAFDDRSSFSQKCQDDIDAIAAGAPSYIDKSTITIDDLQAAAARTSFANGVGSQVSQATLYPTSPQAAASVAGQTIGAIFSDPTKLVTAVTTLGGSTMFINASAISGNLAANEGLLMHEMLHELGLTDDNIGNALHSIDPSIKPDANGNWTNTKQFSKKLQSDCFSGKDNKN